VSELVPFSFNGHAVRVLMRAGEPWFVAADVCRILEIADVRQAVERLDEDERGGCSVPTPGGVQEMRCVSESGLYSLVLGSRKPEARMFKRWVTHDVIPSIRRTGSYASDPIALLGDPHVLRQLLGSYAERVQALEATVADQKPKVEVFDRIIAAGDTFGFREAAQQIRAGTGASEHEVRGLMRARGWIQRLGKQLAPAHEGVARGYVTTRERSWTDETGATRVRPELRVTPKGIARYIELLLATGAA